MGCVAIPLAVGGLSALLTKDSMAVFEYVKKPALSPPGTVFPIAWTVLYILMGIASYIVLNAEVPRRRIKGSLSFYAAQLIFNFFWSLIFFNSEQYLFAFIWLCALWLLILITTAKFFEIDKRAGWLLVPYIAWVSFAGYLNYGVYMLN